jgi:hypothetical protein
LGRFEVLFQKRQQLCPSGVDFLDKGQQILKSRLFGLFFQQFCVAENMTYWSAQVVQ